ncbi:MAG: aminotransferase [Betaproteobacteria bacterium RIFCSPLOWO2_02_FULL_65_24]|nr:MAG: aminotransferase [Betaproteobacteria bacterium RIFCSPLOWO2_02_FULL_65_24]OGA33713.1 MAG: aminotransferase [Betaproteobacteria bacterium RIFCSPLOWO2_12_FULL_62_13b]
MIFSGVLDLSWWGLILAALAFTHVTIVAVTVFLHRCQAHRALELHPAVSHFFRFWLWLTTGMVTREWAAVHRKHHAKCEAADDPHSPQIYGINRVLWLGAVLYARECGNRETIERYGHGTPDDWVERNIYSRYSFLGVTLMALADMLLFGVLPGLAIFAVQMLWIPFWAAGVVNGIGHWFGYRNWQTADASRNIVPFGILIGGEELHNNHHAYASSAKLSSKWYELDIGWFYIRLLKCAGLAEVKKLAPTPRFSKPKPTADFETLHAVIANRYDVLAKYAKSLKATYAEELRRLRRLAPQDAKMMKGLKRWLHRDESSLAESERARLAQVLAKHQALETAYTMRKELMALWDRSTASREQLLKQLQDWCRRAEASGIRPLQEFSQRLRCYA